MPKKLFDSASAREAGKRSGQARYKLTLAQVEAELGTLVTLEDAQRRLDRIGVWALLQLTGHRTANIFDRYDIHEMRDLEEATAVERGRVDIPNNTVLLRFLNQRKVNTDKR